MSLRPLRYWVPSLAWMLFLFVCSTDYFSADSTRAGMENTFSVLKGGVPPDKLDLINLIFRKCCHVVGYSVLAYFFAVGFQKNKEPWCGLHLKTVAYVFLATIAYAVLDEWHQSFSPVREATLKDVLWDASGAAIALAAMVFYQYSSVCKLPEIRP